MSEVPSACRICALVRAAWRALRLALLPRTLAFFGALAVLVMMAPSSLPPSTIRAAPASAPAGPLAASAAAAASAAVAAAAAQASAGAATAVARGASAVQEALGRAGLVGDKGSDKGGDRGGDRAGGRSSAPPLQLASAAAGAAGAASAAAVRFRNALPPARVGAPWRYKVLEGTPPFVMRFVGERPSWIEEFAAGTLAGTPREAKSYEFTLQGSTESGTPTVTQTFAVRVLPAAPQAAASAPRVLGRLNAAELAATPPVERDVPFTWRLDDVHIEKLARGGADSDDPQALAPEGGVSVSTEVRPPPVPPPLTAGQWKGMLGALVGVDYPTEAHFRTVLRIAHCAYYKELLAAAARERTNRGPHRVVAPSFDCDEAQNVRDPTSPPPPGAGKARTPEEKAVQAALTEDFIKLLPLKQEDEAVLLARRPHRLRKDFSPQWQAKPGCGCVPPARDEEVYGFVSYWGTADQQGTPPAPADTKKDPGKPGPEARETDFSLFSRISYFGAMLNDLAGYDMPIEVKVLGHQLAVVAQRHGVQVDLVVHRNDWSLLDGRNDAQIAKVAQRAAENIMPVLGEPHGKLAFGQSLLLPFWRQENMPFSGLTIFFDNLPARGSEAARKFRVFQRAFVLGVIAQMQGEQKSLRRQGRFRLNVMVPDHLIDEDDSKGLLTFAEMIAFIEQAERPVAGKKVEIKDRAHYAGTTDITLNYIVLLSDRTTTTKKALRARLDQSSQVTGTRRVVLLESLVPMLLRPTAARALWGPDEPGQQFSDDLAYMKWSFGGAALWELPSTAKLDLQLMNALESQFRLDKRRARQLCDVVCPRRIALRLWLQGLVALGAVAIALWFLSCEVRNLGRAYLRFLVLGGAVTVSLALLLLECDPVLHDLNETNWPLFALVAAVFAAGLYWSLRSRRARP